MCKTPTYRPRQCRARGVRALVCKADVGTDAGCEFMVARTISELGRVDLLVNNAGTTTFVKEGDLDTLSTDDFQHIYSVNALGAYRMIRLCAPHMRAVGGGRVVNVSSVAGVYHTVGRCTR